MESSPTKLDHPFSFIAVKSFPEDHQIIGDSQEDLHSPLTNVSVCKPNKTPCFGWNRQTVHNFDVLVDDVFRVRALELLDLSVEVRFLLRAGYFWVDVSRFSYLDR